MMESPWSFDQRAATYDNLQWVNDAGLLGAMTKLIEMHMPSGIRTLLDLATGTGVVARALARPETRVIGLDLSWPMLEQAVQRKGNIYYIQARGEALPIKSATVDLAVSRNGLHQMVEPGLALREIRRALNRRGRLCVIESVAPPEPVKAHWRKIILLKDRGRHQDFTYTANELRTWIEQHGFTIAEAVSYDIRFDVDEWVTMGGVTGDRARQVRDLFEFAPMPVVEAMEIRRHGSRLSAKKTSHIAIATPRI
jgi:ubiquinone/menaquinone biosynthesis C-methylase UbiE